MKNKKIAIGVWALAILVFTVAAILIFATKTGETISLPKQNTDISEPVDDSTSNQSSQNTTGQELSLPKNLPENLKVQTLTSKDNQNKDDATFIAYVDGNKLTVVIEAKLPEPASKEHYAAWLVKNSVQGYFNLGKLEKVNNNFGISTSLDGGFSEYKTAIVTLETLEDNTPEKVILEGTI